MRYLITGGCGFLGSNLGAEVLRRGDELFVFDNLFRFGSSNNLAWLKQQGEFKYYPYDIRNNNDIENVIKDIKPEFVFHLAGQVAMSTSVENPRMDFEVNALGTFNLLDSIRKYSPETIVLYSSTNKVFGDFGDLNFDETDTRYICRKFPKGFNEQLPLNFHSPYGCSKGAADQYLLDFNRMYETRTVVFRHSSMYGGNQHATFDQGWIGWFCHKAIEIENGEAQEDFTIFGTGKQVRDVLHSDDVVRLYFKASEHINNIKGEAFNIGGGIENSLSLLELFKMLEEELDITMNYKQLPWRVSDQKVFVADNTKIDNAIEWQPRVDKRTGIIRMLNWLKR
ncbi:MAG: GDP-mannose 4,6-dehydratase [Cyclobacteriaceae bacterium]